MTNSQIETIMILRENFMYPTDEDTFFKHLNTLDENPANIERVCKKNANMCFTITQYFRDNHDMVEETIKYIL